MVTQFVLEKGERLAVSWKGVQQLAHRALNLMSSADFFGAPTAQKFNTTHWSVVTLACQTQSPHSLAALEKLCRTYWPPLYAFIRRRGYPEEDARDLTQEFFARLLERNEFEAVDPRKGKFRTFLLAALTHFLSNQRDHDHAAKRGGGQQIISLQEINDEQWRHLEPAWELSPDKLFDVRWAATVLERALMELRRELADEGRAAQFEALKGFLTEDPGDGDYAAIAARLGAAKPAVAVMVYRLRQRYRELVRAEVAHTVCNPLEVDEEMRHLLEALSA
jgi:RNA polymerase sigma factor (sigma-70 family)